MTFYRKKRYSTKSTMGRLKNALDEISYLKHDYGRALSENKILRKRIAELVTANRKIREMVDTETTRAVKVDDGKVRSKAQRTKLKFPKIDDATIERAKQQLDDAIE